MYTGLSKRGSREVEERETEWRSGKANRRCDGGQRGQLKGEAGEMTVDVPRDREGTFEPKIIEKHQMRFEVFDVKILAMYALGITGREIVVAGVWDAVGRAWFRASIRTWWSHGP